MKPDRSPLMNDLHLLAVLALILSTCLLLWALLLAPAAFLIWSLT